MNLFWFLESSSTPSSRTGTLAHQLRRSRLVMWMSFLSLLIFLIWAWLAQIDQITRAPGAVIASSRTQIVQSHEGGILEQLVVREGDTVERGQVLARLERTRAETAWLETRARAAALTATVARLQGEVFGTALRCCIEGLS